MQNISAGLVAGLVATLVLSALMVVKGMMGLMPELDVAAMIGVMMGASVVVGWIVHFMIGTIAWGGGFALLYAQIPGGMAWHDDHRDANGRRGPVRNESRHHGTDHDAGVAYRIRRRSGCCLPDACNPRTCTLKACVVPRRIPRGPDPNSGWRCSATRPHHLLSMTFAGLRAHCHPIQQPEESDHVDP